MLSCIFQLADDFTLVQNSIRTDTLLTHLGPHTRVVTSREPEINAPSGNNAVQIPPNILFVPKYLTTNFEGGHIFAYFIKCTNVMKITFQARYSGVINTKSNGVFEIIWLNFTYEEQVQYGTLIFSLDICFVW